MTDEEIKMVVRGTLKHHGVMGMKWGKHKAKGKTTSLTTRDGSKISLEQSTPNSIQRFLQAHNKHIASEAKKTTNISLKDKNGKKIGDLQTYETNPHELNVTWIGVNKSQRGHGVASSVMGGVIEHAKKKGYKTVTLEVPGNANDARHIYEKHGFKAGKTISDENDSWGGLTEMKLDLK